MNIAPYESMKCQVSTDPLFGFWGNPGVDLAARIRRRVVAVYTRTTKTTNTGGAGIHSSLATHSTYYPGDVRLSR